MIKNIFNMKKMNKENFKGIYETNFNYVYSFAFLRLAGNKEVTEDIVVFYSNELKETLIKRLIGLPGDEIDIKADGQVFINGNKTEEPYIDSKDIKGKAQFII
jgi:signal peptidase I